MLKRIFLILLFLSWAPVAGFAQDEDENEIKKHPGFFNLDEISDILDDEPTVEIQLKGFLLRMVAGATRGSEPELSSMLRRLLLVRVEKYRLRRDDVERVVSKNNEIAKRLSKDGWEKIVRVREDRENVNVFVKPGEDRIDGIVVLVVDNNREAVFVNIVGEIDPEQIGRLGGKWDIHGLDNLDFEF